MQSVFSSVVQWAWQKFRFGVDPSPRRAAELYEKLAVHYRRLVHIDNEVTLQSFLPGKKGGAFDLYAEKAIMVLRVVEEGDIILPFLTMSYRFDSDPGKVWIQLVLICLDQHAGSAEGFGSLGYRIEPPELAGANGLARSKHDYYHVQPIRKINKREADSELKMCPLWLPDSCPTWPLHVEGPVQAFLSVLVGLYGLTAIRELLSDTMDLATREAVLNFVKRIAPESFPPTAMAAARRTKKKG